MSKESFKDFAKKHPELANHVLTNKSKTWQDFYELYEVYGETNSVWDNYLKKTDSSMAVTSNGSVNDLINMVKKVDLETVQKTVGNLQKTLGLLQDIGLGGATTTAAKASEYQPRPMYRYFDD